MYKTILIVKLYLNKSQKIPLFRSTVLICHPSSLESLVTVRTLQIKEGEYEETRKKRKNDRQEKVCQYKSREKEEK